MIKKENKSRFRKGFFDITNLVIFSIGVLILFGLLFNASKLNIRADSLDYYAILQKLTPEKESKIVENLYFADQRSPGYPILSLIPYFVLDEAIEPFVETKEFTDFELFALANRNRMPPSQQGLQPPPVDENLLEPDKMSSEFRIIPPVPIDLNSLLFNNFYIAPQGSWFQWKIAFSLFLTSVIFLIIGITSNVLLFKNYFKSYKAIFIIPLVLLISPVFMRNITDFPLYPSLTVYGLSSLFLYLFIKTYDSDKTIPTMLLGLVSGFLVLTRLELVVFLVPFIIFLFFQKRYKYLKNVFLGGTFPFHILLIYNYTFYGFPFNFAILKGDINVLSINLNYISENLFHPNSGIIFWTPALLPGLISLFFSRNLVLKIIGISAFSILLLYLVKIPVMYFHIGESFMEIGGIPVNVPVTADQMRFLIRSDINRYIIVLIPVAIFGIRNAFEKLFNRNS